MSVKVGDRLYARTGDYGRASRGFHIDVKKVGRKWASYRAVDSWQTGRFALEDWVIDGGEYSSPGRVYASEDAYEEEARANRLWAEFTKHFGWGGRPREVDALAILKAADALGFRLESE